MPPPSPGVAKDAATRPLRARASAEALSDAMTRRGQGIRRAGRQVTVSRGLSASGGWGPGKAAPSLVLP
jgi:hypothetical protein